MEILLVEDNPGDVRLTREALKSARVPHQLHVARDGVEAVAYLRQQGEFGGAPRPDLILLDLNLPRKDGLEVLMDIKSDHGLKQIPVVVLTTSSAEDDIVQAYKSHANCCITKPLELQAFLAVIQAIEQFWFGIVRLPPNDRFMH